jgi:GT2 family glycosyltransferase
LPRLRDFDFHLTYEEQFRDSDVIDCVADPTICGLFKRKALEAVDGFDLEYPYAEDLRLLQKFRNRGYRVLMVHEPGVYHYHRENYRDVYRQAYNHGVGRRMFMDQTKGRFYSKKDPIRFAILALRNGTKAGLGVLLIYPFYRAFTEAAFLMGYLSGERNFKSDRAPQRRTDKDLEVDLVGSGPTEVQA